MFLMLARHLSITGDSSRTIARKQNLLLDFSDWRPGEAVAVAVSTEGPLWPGFFAELDVAAFNYAEMPKAQLG